MISNGHHKVIGQKMLPISITTPSLLALLGGPEKITSEGQPAPAAHFASILSLLPAGAAKGGEIPDEVAEPPLAAGTGNILPLALPVLPVPQALGPSLVVQSPPAGEVAQSGSESGLTAQRQRSTAALPVEMPARVSSTIASLSVPLADQTAQTARPSADHPAISASIPVMVRNSAPLEDTSSAAERPAGAPDPAPARLEVGAPRTPIEAQALQQPGTPAPDAATTDHAPRHHNAAPAVSNPAQPGAADVTAALDRLVAAREAFVPAQATVKVEHSDFGPVSIRFEQNAAGQLSVELSASDPDLRRAVAAAAPADAPSTNAGDPGSRGAGQSPGGEARPQSDRGSQDRRGQPRTQPERDRSASRSGTFA